MSQLFERTPSYLTVWLWPPYVSELKPAVFGPAVVVARAEGLDAPVDRLILRPVAFDLLRPSVHERRSAQVVRSALRHDVDDAAGGLAELGLVAAGLDLDFIDEVERRRV